MFVQNSTTTSYFKKNVETVITTQSLYNGDKFVNTHKSKDGKTIINLLKNTITINNKVICLCQFVSAEENKRFLLNEFDNFLNIKVCLN